WATLSLVFLVTMIGMTLIPHLMMEEKQTHTLEALLVSPASAGKVIGAKAIVGLVYCMVGAGVTMALYYRLVTHWWLLILTAIVLSLFAVSIGLLLGIIVENRGQLNLWAWVFLVPFMLPIFLAQLEGLLPETLIQVFRYIPTVVAFNLVRSSYTYSISMLYSLVQVAWVAVWAGALLLGVAWLVNRRDREGTFVPAMWNAQLDSPAPKTAAAGNADVDTAGIFTTFAASLPWVQRRKEKTLAVDVDASQIEAGDDATGTSQGLRIIWSIANKDIRDAYQNKLVIAIILGALVMVATSSVLPLLLRLQDKPAAIVYESGRSTIVRGLTGQEDFILGLSDSVKEMEQRVIELPMSPIGLIIPSDFDQKAGGEEVIEIEARAAHWSNPNKVAQWMKFFEQKLSEASWSPVKVNLASESLYPTTETGGQPMVTALLLVVGLLTIGIALVPLLMVEEKESHTFDALLVSPASFSQIVSGKALAGAFYAFMMVLAILLLNSKLFVHWET
ncbi:MAG: ABC transporter permease, partial [Anaerolineales bacterium]